METPSKQFEVLQAGNRQFNTMVHKICTKGPDGKYLMSIEERDQLASEHTIKQLKDIDTCYQDQLITSIEAGILLDQINTVVLGNSNPKRPGGAYFTTEMAIECIRRADLNPDILRLFTGVLVGARSFLIDDVRFRELSK